jgi:hypothetical protein
MDVAIIILSSMQSMMAWLNFTLYVCEVAFLVLFKIVHLLLYVLQLGGHRRHLVLQIPNGWTPGQSGKTEK